MADKHFKRAALDFLSGLRINEVTRRQNERTRGENFCPPTTREGEINDRIGSFGRHGCVLYLRILASPR